MRWLFTLILSAFMAVVAQAQSSPNNVLAQLGVKGVTDKVYGTNPVLYANYLIKTYTNGLMDVSLLPTEASPHRWYKTAFIDSVNGLDATNSGTATCPYKTFVYAAARITNDTAFVFTPGAYTAGTVTNANAHHVALIGLDYTNTVMTGILNFNASLPAGTMDISVYLSGVTVQDIRQYQYGTLTVEAYNRAKVTGNITRLYTTANSYGTLFADPSASIANVISGANSTNYVKAYIPAGTAAGQLAYWNGTNWLTAAVGATNQVLFGGSAPYWSYPNFVYTNLPGDFLPAVSNVYSIGSQAMPWSNGWFGTALYLNGTNLYSIFATNAGVGSASVWVMSNGVWTAYAPTLDSVCQVGSNTMANLQLNGSHNTIGYAGTEAWTVPVDIFPATGALNLGNNEGTRLNDGYGNINAGNPKTGTFQAFDTCLGSVNLGEFSTSGGQTQYQAAVSLNIGSGSQGLQSLYMSGGSMNFGYVSGATQSIVNILDGQSALGAVNGGSLRPGAFQYNSGGGAFNWGWLQNGYVQTNTGNGSFILGGRGTNTFNYAILLGDGLVGLEANAVHARKYYENGVALANTYATTGSVAAVSNRVNLIENRTSTWNTVSAYVGAKSNQWDLAINASTATNIATSIVTNYIVGSGHMYMTEIGVTSVLYHVTSAGHTNKIGEFYTP